MYYFLIITVIFFYSCAEVTVPENDDTPPIVSLNSTYDMRIVYDNPGLDRWEVLNDRETTFPFVDRNYSHIFWNLVEDPQSGARTARIWGNVFFLCVDNNDVPIFRESFSLPLALNTGTPFVEIGDTVPLSRSAITHFSIAQLDCICQERDSSLVSNFIRAEIHIDGFNYFGRWNNKYFGELNFESK